MPHFGLKSGVILSGAEALRSAVEGSRETATGAEASSMLNSTGFFDCVSLLRNSAQNDRVKNEMPLQTEALSEFHAQPTR
jgi:hypothetical protein